MQKAYATSADALNLMAETQIIMGAARANSADLPEQGHSATTKLGTPSSLDVLQAPRECECHVDGSSFTLKLVPQENASIQHVTAAALHVPTATQPSGPAAPDLGRKK